MLILLTAENLQYENRISFNSIMFITRYTKIHASVQNTLGGNDTQNRMKISMGNKQRIFIFKKMKLKNSIKMPKNIYMLISRNDTTSPLYVHIQLPTCSYDH
jgi:hypothetical protein